MEQVGIGEKKKLDIFTHILVTYSLSLLHFLFPSRLPFCHTHTYTQALKMGTSTHMGIWKVALDICSPSKHLKGISTGEK